MLSELDYEIQIYPLKKHLKKCPHINLYYYNILIKLLPKSILSTAFGSIPYHLPDYVQVLLERRVGNNTRKVFPSETVVWR